MRHWEQFKDLTKKAALSKPLRWLVSGVTGLTFGATLLKWLLDLLPATEGFLAVDLIIIFVTAGLVTRLTSRGYTAVEEALHKVEEQSKELNFLKKEFRTQHRELNSHDKMVKRIINDIKQQNENNMSFYLQQVGILRFCEEIARQFPENQAEILLQLLDPPSQQEIQGRRPPSMLESVIIPPEEDKENDAIDALEITISPAQDNSPHLSPGSSPNEHTTGFFYNLYQSTQNLKNNFYGSFWRSTDEQKQIELALSNKAFLESLPSDAYEDLESPPEKKRQDSETPPSSDDGLEASIDLPSNLRKLSFGSS